MPNTSTPDTSPDTSPIITATTTITTASIDYLQPLPLYRTTKPYYALLAPSPTHDPNAQRLDNLEYESHTLPIHNIRLLSPAPSLSDYGFEVLSHESQFTALESREECARYQRETEAVLRERLGAVWVKCYEVRKRENVRIEREVMDYNDPLLIEGPAKGAHNDVTYKSGPQIINRYMTDAEKAEYLKPGYRFRILNTWRSLVPNLEDRPLALCDSRSVAPRDLVAADRIIPDRVGEIYYLTYNPSHQWYWLEHQSPNEPFVFVMYDTQAGPHARFCPHVSFDNSHKAANAAPRRSVETRSIVITRD